MSTIKNVLYRNDMGLLPQCELGLKINVNSGDYIHDHYLSLAEKCAALPKKGA